MQGRPAVARNGGLSKSGRMPAVDHVDASSARLSSFPHMGNRILYALAVRVLIAVFTQTFFQPDEYFQALEPAHHLVFGYGSLTWEWLNPLPIRSIIYPALNIPIYWMLKVTGLHSIRFWGDWLVVGSFDGVYCFGNN